MLVVLAVDDLLEAPDVSAIGTYLPVSPVNCSATKNGCDRNFWILRARDDRQLVVLGQLVDAEDRDDVLQVLVALQDLLHLRGRRCSARRR